MFLKRGISWLNRLGVRAQLVLLFVVMFGAFFAVFSAAVFSYVARAQQKHFDSALFNYVIDVSHSVTKADFAKGVSLQDTEMILPFSMGETLLQVVRTDGTVLVRSRSLGSRQLPFSVNNVDKLSRDRGLFRDVVLPASQGGDGRYRMVSHLAHREALGDFIVQAAVPNVLLYRQQESLLTFFSVSIPLMLLLAALFGLGFSGRAMAPVSAIIAKANEIEAKHLSEDIPIPESRDEIRDLAVTLNGLLRRLEKAFRSQEGFIADASHQLKTPLAILKGELELFRRAEKTPDVVERFAASAAQEVDYLTKMLEDLLMLARMDAEGGTDSMQTVQVDEKLLECVARFERVGKPRDVRFCVNLEMEAAEQMEKPFTIRGEPDLLRSLIENLLDNAVKYSPNAGVVQVSLFDRANVLSMVIEDQGAGIPESVFSRLFERFYRSESTRDVISGSGLGLSIVKRIAELHGGVISASNRKKGGACFEVALPKCPA